jgi:hypothetical protein
MYKYILTYTSIQQGKEGKEKGKGREIEREGREGGKGREIEREGCQAGAGLICQFRVLVANRKEKGIERERDKGGREREEWEEAHWFLNILISSTRIRRIPCPFDSIIQVLFTVVTDSLII